MNQLINENFTVVIKKFYLLNIVILVILINVFLKVFVLGQKIKNKEQDDKSQPK